MMRSRCMNRGECQTEGKREMEGGYNISEENGGAKSSNNDERGREKGLCADELERVCVVDGKELVYNPSLK